MLVRLKNMLYVAGAYMVEKGLPMLFLTILGILTVRIVMTLVRKMLEKSKLEKAAHTLILTACQIALYVLLALVVASGLGIDVTSLVAMASVLTLAVSLAVQNLLANVFGGFTLLYTKPFASEDFVEIAGQSGTVKEIGLSYTKLATADNKIVSIPTVRWWRQRSSTIPSAVPAAWILTWSSPLWWIPARCWRCWRRFPTSLRCWRCLHLWWLSKNLIPIL